MGVVVLYDSTLTSLRFTPETTLGRRPAPPAR